PAQAPAHRRTGTAIRQESPAPGGRRLTRSTSNPAPLRSAGCCRAPISGPIFDSAPGIPAGRRTGVKNGGGTARDVVVLLVRLRPRFSPTPGAGYPRGRV